MKISKQTVVLTFFQTTKIGLKSRKNRVKIGKTLISSFKIQGESKKNKKKQQKLDIFGANYGAKYHNIYITILCFLNSFFIMLYRETQ